jgi:hypothetical protein
MRREQLAVILYCAVGVPAGAAGQSSLLTALESWSPAPTLDPTTAALTRGLAAIWTDPTGQPTAKGLFLSMSQASYASVRVFHGGVGFQLGPRWSVAYASTDLGELFDSSLTNQDPTLSSLRAQALLGRVDATFGPRRVTASVGLALAGDNNVGVLQSSTIARAHVRVRPLGTDQVALGAQLSRPIGGSVPSSGKGRGSVDLTVTQSLGLSSVSVTAAASRGSLWRYSETRGGYAAALQVSFLSQLDLGVALARYASAYGASTSEWARSVTADLHLGDLRVGARYSSCRLSFGSGFGVSLGYEPAPSP